MSVSLCNVQVNLQGEALFSALSITLRGGELLAIMGPSGCGKSTLLAAIAGSLSSELTLTGEILLAGRRIEALPMQQRGIGIQFQEDLLFPHLNVAGNLLFALARGKGKEAKVQRQKAVAQALESAGLAGFEQRDVATLSGGQKARVSLLRTLLAKPKLLLLDEPFSRLDDQRRSEFRAFVFDQVKQMNIPAILVSHDQQDCPNDRYYSLESGQFHNVS
ncbi:MAG: ATP-binding cassette domain-containing protein [Oceanospirillaceae bacterium]